MAIKYTGSKCIVCEKIFNDDSDVVVCPDCGTPYHRECWKIENKCINTELHEKGLCWTEEKNEPNPQTRCMRCGTFNEAGTDYCTECGLPLARNVDTIRPFPYGNNYQNQNPYFQQQNMNQQNMNPNFFGQNGESNNQQFGRPPQQNGIGFGGIPVQQIKLTENSDIDGVKLGDYFSYVGRKSLSMIANFVKFAKTPSKTSFNIAALLFPEYYFFYRKMYKKGLLIFFISFLLNIPTLIYYGQSGEFGKVLFETSINLSSTSFVALINTCSMANTIISVFTALYANYWYYKKAKSDITDIRFKESDEKTAKALMESKGGISWKSVILAIIANVIMSLAVCILLAAFL